MKARMCTILLIVIMLLSGCQQGNIIENPEITSREWNLLLESATGTDVTLYYTSSDENLERWLTRSVVPGVLSANGINLELVKKKPMMEIKERLQDQKMNEIDTGSIDLIYIEDSSFKEMMDQGLLYGPFLEKLPNYYANVNQEDYEFLYEQGISSNGHFMPVGREQLMFIYDEDMILDPPTTMDMFVETLRTAPGQFSFPLPPEKSGVLFMETFIASYVNYEKLYQAEPTREVVEPMIQPAIEALMKLKPKLWKEGAIFPEDEEHLDQLFYDGKVSFALSTDINKASTYAKAEVYPYAARAFILDDGTAGTNTGVVIAHSAPNKSGAMIVADYLLTAETQAFKYDPSKWGNIPVVDTSMMVDEEAKKIKGVTMKRSDMKQDMLNSHRVPPMPKDLEMVVSEIWIEALEYIVEE